MTQTQQRKKASKKTAKPRSEPRKTMTPAQKAALEKAQAALAAKRAKKAPAKRSKRPVKKAAAKPRVSGDAGERKGLGADAVRQHILKAKGNVSRAGLIEALQGDGWDKVTAGYAVTNSLRLLKRSGVLQDAEGRGAYSAGPNYKHLGKETDTVYPEGAWS